jgi:predicted nuclease of predicted toxin-antitoxin system
MRFVVDESADARVAVDLRRRGHDVKLIAQDYRPGLPDPDVLAIARREERILITDDRDFGELVFRHQHAHAGVIYFRLSSTVLELRIARLVLVEFCLLLGSARSSCDSTQQNQSISRIA